MGVEATRVKEKHDNNRQTILTELVKGLYLERKLLPLEAGCTFCKI